MICHKTPVLLAGQERRLQDAVKYLHKQQAYFYDVESVGEYRIVPKLNTVTWISISSKGIDLVIPMGHVIGTRIIGEHKEPRADKNGKVRYFRVPDYEDPPPQMDRGNVFEILAPLFLDERIIKVAQDQPFDAGSIAKYLPGGELPRPPMDDTKVREWLINENNTNLIGIKETVKRRFRVVWDTENVGKRVETYPFDTVAHYSYMDSHMGWLTYERQHADLRREYGDDTRVIRLERELLPIMCQMRLAGTPVDVPRLREMEVQLSERLVDEEAAVYKAAGREFNINSNPQKQEILYGPKSDGGQGLKPWKLTPGGKEKKKAGEKEDISWYSTSDDVLESYPDNDVACSLRTYGDTNKLLGTYVQGWLGVEGNKNKPPRIFDGWIYTSFKQVGPVTGRFASADPNLQNIPRPDDEDGKLIRGAVLAPPGWKLVVADLGQIEPRITAHFLGKGMLYEGFLNGIDPYIVNAAAALGKDIGDVTKAERQKFGKTLMLSMNYGQGDKATAAKMGISLKHAQEILNRHADNMPEVEALKRGVCRVARDREPPHIKTLLGRKRRVPELNSSQQWLRERAERQLFNSLIQGSAADLIKLGMIWAARLLRNTIPEAFISLTVHDEIVVLAPDDKAEQAKDILVEAMIGPHIQKLVRVPLTVDAVVCQRWNEAK